jgi:hypothetical protein
MDYNNNSGTAKSMFSLVMLDADFSLKSYTYPFTLVDGDGGTTSHVSFDVVCRQDGEDYIVFAYDTYRNDTENGKSERTVNVQEAPVTEVLLRVA